MRPQEAMKKGSNKAFEMKRIQENSKSKEYKKERESIKTQVIDKTKENKFTIFLTNMKNHLPIMLIVGACLILLAAIMNYNSKPPIQQTDKPVMVQKSQLEVNHEEMEGLQAAYIQKEQEIRVGKLELEKIKENIRNNYDRNETICDNKNKEPALCNLGKYTYYKQYYEKKK